MKNSKINSKSKLKIIIMSLMAIFVVFGSLGACSAATDANIVVSLAPQTQHVCDGQQVQMDIWVNNSNITVEGFESTIAYDSNNLKLVDIQLSDVANTAGLKDANVAGNSISLAWIGGGITETSFKIATLTFNTSNISTNEVLLRNIDMTKDGGVSTTPISEHILGANVRVLGYYPNILEVTVLPELIYEGIVTLDVDSKLINPGFANESMSVNFSLNDKNYTMNYDATSKSFKVQIPDLVLDASTLNGKVSAQYVEKVAQQDVSIVVNTPDIAIGEITVDNPYYSTPAKITVPVSNEGSVTLKDTASYTISVYADSTLLKTENIRPLVAGETQEIIVDWTAEKPSTKIIAELSFDDENISNNKVLKTIDVTENTISVNLTENKSLVTVDEYFNITIDLNKLDGVRTVNGFEFILNFDKNLVMCENSTFLIPESDINLKLIDIDNNNGIIRYSIVIDGITNNMPIVKAKFKALNSGNSTFELTNVSISDKTSEFNNVELNNAKVEIISSDIGINAIIPDSYNIGQKVTLDVDVTNNGHVDITKPFKVSLYVDANNPIEKTINSLQVGATETIQFEWANNAKITTLLTIIADDSNAVSEENESNNRLSKSVKIVDDAINVYTAKKDPNEKGFIFTLNAKDVAEYRKCAGFEGTLNLKNLVVKDQMLSGTFSNYNAETGYFGGFNFTENKYGEFELANFVLEIVNTSKPYVVNITNIELSDEQSNSYGNVTFNTTSILGGVILRSPENVGGENVVVNSNGNIVEYVGGEIIWSPATEKMPAGNRIGIQIVGPEGVDTSNSKIKIGDVESKWDDVKGIDNTLCYYLIVNEENKKFTITAVWNNVSNQVFNITVDDAVILDSPIAIESVTPEEGAKLSGSFDISVTLSEVASKYSAIIDEKTANEKIVTLTPKDTTYTGNVTGITSGAHTLKINVSESNGNKAVKTISFTVDAEAPTITLTPINGTIVNEGSLEVTAVLNEGSITSASLDDVAVEFEAVEGQENTYTATIETVAGNKNNLTVVAQDNLGNEATEEVIYVVDAEAPTITLTPINGTIVNEGSLEVTAVLNEGSITSASLDDVAVEFKAVEDQENTYTATIETVAGNKNNLTVVAQDNLGNEATEEVIYVVDAEAPTITLTPINGTIVNEGSLEVTAVLNEGSITSASLDDVAVEFKAVEDQENTYTATIETVAGNKNNLTVVAQDNLGNEATEEVIYVVDAEAPTFSGVRPVNDHVFIDDKNIIIKAVVNDENIDTVKAIITPVDGASLPAETLSLKGNVYQSNPIAGLTNGTYLFTITAKDTLGNENTTEEYNFSVKLVSNDTVKEALKNINISADVWDEINISNVTTEEEEGFNVTSINLNNETLEIPVMKNVSTNISKELIIKLKKSNEKAKELKTTLKTSAEAQDSLNKIKEAMADAKVLNNGFNVTNVTSEMTVNSNKVSANLKFIANNTTKKGYVIFRIPLSDFTVKGVSIKVNDKKHAITTEKSEFGWYKLLDNDGARELELTLLQDPEVDVEFEKTLPTTSSGSSSSSNNRGSRHHSTSDSITTSSMISGSKIVYANLDKDYAKSLKSSVCECTEGLKIDDDTIIVGGPLANALTKEYMNQFPVSITNSNPGENKGTIQMMTIKSEGTGIVTEYNIVLLAGSDRFGTQAAVEYFKTLEEVPEEPIYVEWTSSGVKVVNN